MRDAEFSANYYALLGLDPALDAASHRELIAKKIEQQLQDWKAQAQVVSGDSARNFDVRLGLKIAGQMSADLAEQPPAVWDEHARLRKKELGAAAARRALEATEYFDVLGDVPLDEETRQSIVRQVGDAQVVADLVSLRKLTVTKDPTADFDAHVYDRVMKIRQALASIAGRLGHETVYELITAYSGIAVSSATPIDELKTALARLEPNSGKMERRNVANALYNAVSPLIQADPASPGKASAVKRLFDELERFDKAVHLERFLETTIRKLQRIDVAQFDRLCALAQKHTGLDEGTVRRHFRTLCRLWKITPPLAVTGAPERFQVCACCAALNRGNAKQCANCGQDLFETCFNCGTSYAAVSRRCPSCGTDDACSAAARASVALGRAHVGALELAEAQSRLETARAAAPRAKEVQALAASIEVARRQQAERLGELDGLMAERRMHASKALLEQLSHAMSDAERARRVQAVAGAIERAEAWTGQARAEAARGAFDAATELLDQALAQVADHVPAQRAIASIPPPGPSRLVARREGPGIQLSWRSPPALAWKAHAFKVVRAVGHAPAGPGDGDLVGETRAHALVDAGCPIAAAVHYAVFSVRAAAHCAEPARIGPVLLLPPVSGVRVSQQDGRLRFDWTPPERAQDTAIYRLGLADDLAAALARPPKAIARAEWIDSEVVEGRPMRYAFVARYAIEGRIAGAEPLVCDTTPAPAPTAIALVQVSGTARMVWQPAPLADEADEIHVFDAASRTVPAADTILRVEDLPEPALCLRPSAGTSTRQLDLFGEYTLVVVRRRGELARCAKAYRLRHLPAVEALQLTQNDCGVKARWNWPPGCTLAAVKLRCDGAEAGTRQVQRAGNAPQGSCLLEAATPAAVDVAVTAVTTDGRLSSDERKAQIHLRAKNTLSFKIGAAPVRAARGWFGGGAARRGPVIRITLDHPEPLPAFEVRFSPELLPKRHEGRQLVVTQPGSERVRAAEIELSMLEGERGFVNLWLVDPVEAERFTVVPLEPRL